MGNISLADAKAHLSELVDRVAAGDCVCITRRGVPVAQLTQVSTPRRPIDLASLQAVTGSMQRQSETAGDFVRRMRDEDRY